MIILISWGAFQSKFLMMNSVFVKETDSTYEFYSSEDAITVKAVVDKSEEEEQNMAFIERYLTHKDNIIRALDVLPDGSLDSVVESSEMTSPEAVREEDQEEDDDAVLFSTTTTDEEHYHTYEVDEDMNGETIDTYPETHEAHTHQIIEGLIQEANNHIHKAEEMEI